MSERMNILVTGSKGQLGSELRRIAAEPRLAGWTFVFVDIEDLDICNKPAVEQYLRKGKPDIVVNCAAYTAVDKAETDMQTCYAVNRDGVRVLAECCASAGIFLIHVSTDYVFDGTASVPYKESDKVNPTGVYGLSKREGEEAVIASGVNGVIIRTAWLYSEFGNNFVKTMLRLGTEREEVRVVADQHGSPTWAADLADVIARMILDGYIKDRKGVEIFHYTDEGECTWYDFACEIMNLGGRNCRVVPITTGEFPSACRRPAYSVLDKAKIKGALGIEIPHWRVSLKRMLARL